MTFRHTLASLLPVFTALVFAGGACAAEPKVFRVAEIVPPRVSLDPTTVTYHFAGCAYFIPSAATVLPAAATLNGYTSHSACAALGARRDQKIVEIRQQPKLTSRTNVLFIGNSLTYFNELPWIVQQLSEAAGDERPIRSEFVGFGGAKLAQQLVRPETLRRVYGDAWDYVVLQEQSGRALLEPEKTADSVADLDRAIRKSGARTLLFIPWTTATYVSQQQRVTTNFKRIAAAQDVLLAPVGAAWSLSYAARPALRLHDSGGNHPTLAGSYLAALVIYATIRGTLPADLPHAFVHERKAYANDHLARSDALFLQRTARRATAAIAARRPPVCEPARRCTEPY